MVQNEFTPFLSFFGTGNLNSFDGDTNTINELLLGHVWMGLDVCVFFWEGGDVKKASVEKYFFENSQLTRTRKKNETDLVQKSFCKYNIYCRHRTS
jgi:hypothetical protein